MLQRPRRNRKTSSIRAMVEETTLSINDFIYPMFLVEGVNKSIEIQSMPGIKRLSLDLLINDIEDSLNLGIKSIVLFPCLNETLKDTLATESWNYDGLYPQAIHKIKSLFPELCLMTDVAMDPYSIDGHDGLVKNGEILNDETLSILSKMALVQAQAGADIIGPSDMMDGRVKHIRNTLDMNNHTNVSIMSYTAKYASAFYGPFRDALDSTPKFGDKKTYQMNPANKKEALLEASLDESEGADFLMVKPALSYLDIIQSISLHSNLPVAAYNVSGEYAMIKAAAQNGWIDGEKVMLEILLSMKRAGASVILTYFAKEAAKFLK